GARAQEPEQRREGEDPLEESRVAAGVGMTPERFARGMAFADYLKFTGSPENLAREGFDVRRLALVQPRLDWSGFPAQRHPKTRITDGEAAGMKWPAAQPRGPPPTPLPSA